LFLVAGPGTAAARLALAETDQVDLRRGDAFAIERTRARVTIALPDPRVSSKHARLVSVAGRWHVEDLESRNGTFVAGTRTEATALADGDVIDTGDTVLRYRELDDAGTDMLAPAAHDLHSLLPDVQRELDELAGAATSSLTILLEGETGTGKEVVARAIHTRSQRRGAWTPVNCGALPRERVAAELFGWKRGAFPGAHNDHPGLVRASDGGTLFLDEIGDLPIADQATLLRVLQEHEVLPIAASQPVHVDLRVIAATHQPLDELVGQDKFRRDLLARLAGVRATLRPLRERREDLGWIARDLLERHGAGDAVIRAATWRALIAHGWPANIRELELALQRALVRRKPDEPLVVELRGAPPAQTDRRGHLVAAMQRHAGNVAAVARELGKARMQIQRWLRRYEIDPEDYRR
jgi:DNA-binding NtrC family response regulator